MTAHTREPWFWEAGADECPHGPEPEDDTTAAWDEWHDRHQWAPQDVRICLDAPAGNACTECSEDANEFVPWSACRLRPRANRPDTSDAERPTVHRPVSVLVGTEECLERECEEYFTDEGDEIAGKESCSHLTEQEICETCSPAGDLVPVVLWSDCPATTPARTPDDHENEER